jgi:hypothetical protein
MGAGDLALGYAKYQSSWPEQTLQAGRLLRGLLAPLGLCLQLPAYDLKSKLEAERELTTYGLEGDALEQKCLKQNGNIQMGPAVLERELNLWGRSVGECLSRRDEVPVVVAADRKLTEV